MTTINPKLVLEVQGIFRKSLPKDSISETCNRCSLPIKGSPYLVGYMHDACLLKTQGIDKLSGEYIETLKSIREAFLIRWVAKNKSAAELEKYRNDVVRHKRIRKLEATRNTKCFDTVMDLLEKHVLSNVTSCNFLMQKIENLEYKSLKLYRGLGLQKTSIHLTFQPSYIIGYGKTFLDDKCENILGGIEVLQQERERRLNQVRTLTIAQELKTERTVNTLWRRYFINPTDRLLSQMGEAWKEFRGTQKICSYCLTPLAEVDSPVVVCDSCEGLFHKECWIANHNICGIYGCGSRNYMEEENEFDGSIQIELAPVRRRIAVLEGRSVGRSAAIQRLNELNELREAGLSREDAISIIVREEFERIHSGTPRPHVLPSNEEIEIELSPVGAPYNNFLTPVLIPHIEVVLDDPSPVDAGNISITPPGGSRRTTTVSGAIGAMARNRIMRERETVSRIEPAQMDTYMQQMLERHPALAESLQSDRALIINRDVVPTPSSYRDRPAQLRIQSRGNALLLIPKLGVQLWLSAANILFCLRKERTNSGTTLYINTTEINAENSDFLTNYDYKVVDYVYDADFLRSEVEADQLYPGDPIERFVTIETTEWGNVPRATITSFTTFVGTRDGVLGVGPDNSGYICYEGYKIFLTSEDLAFGLNSCIQDGFINVSPEGYYRHLTQIPCHTVFETETGMMSHPGLRVARRDIAGLIIAPVEEEFHGES